MSFAIDYRGAAVDRRFCTAVATVAVLGMVFQIGHFAEHAFQFFIWVFGYFTGFFANICGPDRPWMSSYLMPAVEYMGVLVAPEGTPARQMMLGMETLHLIGNAIFLTGIGATWILMPRSALVKWAFIIEGLHLCEHLILTVSAFVVGVPLGVSTLFGEAGSIFTTKEMVVGYRVTWHFVLNLLPMPLVTAAMIERWMLPQAVDAH